MKKKTFVVFLLVSLTLFFVTAPRAVYAEGETMAESVGGDEILFGMDMWGLGAATAALALVGAGAIGLLTYKKSSSSATPIYYWPTTH
ncbi:MAG: hypothetical protein V1816_22700 [Pseudomonadota bacterium]